MTEISHYQYICVVFITARDPSGLEIQIFPFEQMVDDRMMSLASLVKYNLEN